MSAERGRRPRNKSGSRAVNRWIVQITRKHSQKIRTLPILIRYSVTNLTHSTPAQHAHHSPQNIPVIQTENRTQRGNKRETRKRNLAAVNGVVIPSKVPLGQLPDQGQKVRCVARYFRGGQSEGGSARAAAYGESSNYGHQQTAPLEQHSAYEQNCYLSSCISATVGCERY